MAFGSGETYREAGYSMLFEAYDASAVGSAVGAILDGTDPTACVDMACPVGNPGYYYGAFNDSIVWLSSETAGQRFNINSIAASFIGSNPSLGSYPAVSGLLRIQGWLADGSWVTQDIALNGPTGAGFDFGTYLMPTAFSSLNFVQAAMFGFTCNTTGTCNAFSTNRGQFGIDDLEVTAVPEPATALIFGLGLAGLVAGARRRKA